MNLKLFLRLQHQLLWRSRLGVWMVCFFSLSEVFLWTNLSKCPLKRYLLLNLLYDYSFGVFFIFLGYDDIICKWSKSVTFAHQGFFLLDLLDLAEELLLSLFLIFLACLAFPFVFLAFLCLKWNCTSVKHDYQLTIKMGIKLFDDINVILVK